MPCRVPKRRFSCGAPQHLTKNQSFGFWSFAFRSFPLELDFSKIDPPHQGGKRIADRFASSLCALERAKREIVTGRLSRERDKGGARVGLTLTAAQV